MEPREFPDVPVKPSVPAAPLSDSDEETISSTGANANPRVETEAKSTTPLTTNTPPQSNITSSHSDSAATPEVLSFAELKLKEDTDVEIEDNSPPNTQGEPWMSFSFINNQECKSRVTV